MSIRVDDLVVAASLGIGAWAFYSFGFRARSVPVGIALLAVPALVWIGCRYWLYAVVDEAGLPPLLGGLPAIAVYLGFGWIVYRRIGALTYRLGSPPTSFGRVLQAADLAMQRAYAEAPSVSEDGQILTEPLRGRLERAMADFRALEPPPGTWTKLVEERIALHRAYIEVLMSELPVGRDVFDPLEQRSRDWMREVQQLLAAEERARPSNVDRTPT